MAKFADTRDKSILPVDGKNLVLFHPHVPENAIDEIADTLKTRWIGQGPKVDRFETEFRDWLGSKHHPIAVGSCTDAMHLAYVLAGVQPGDEVIVPVFTCTATSIPLLYHGVKIRFADAQAGTMNIDPGHVRSLVTEKTKAIVCVHYGGLPCDMDELQAIADECGVPLIEDAAQAVGASYRGRPVGGMSDFTAFSFQAIKHITTGDGGMLMLRDPELVDKAQRIRWFGIDRKAKQGGTWANDIYEVGYKYQMTDIGAAMGLAALKTIDQSLDQRKAILATYIDGLAGIDGLEVVGANSNDRVHAAWLCTVLVDRRQDLERKLRDARIESGQVHFRNDRYSVFAPFREGELPNMNAMENRYLVLPLHTHMDVDDAKRVCDVIKSGW
ncbi:DegT/DnrJ/EryC1/StrS family aminotransferase [Roseiconus lacunae]|uniref:DegT/DnrJ/EryC1/StrS family aminotransferase n=1 Tax=Roseiconus lacunae TaxID=2605694 RepID=A0ABT7PKP1_9BACT|nr:DegT/DnrJ/EryC1/StrS family aminotransferase [Roseiconus lacunae]MCD0461130.1 DegT/DnrJ/EryC1/StrS family aminotransferase [Roseiconus lacunae]MDM4017035.1 DegT/DnrJ/EryC1/StrS family aminotransferase [Roseiconus lacunae]WRQ48964.1 DegT/DnrJ/EryC1/StrS family aminotransferase [Stieleria sp. HD01]